MTTEELIMEKRAQQIAAALNQSVTKALERKRRLGQYAVIWDGEKVVRILPDGKISTDNTNTTPLALTATCQSDNPASDETHIAGGK